MEKHWWCQATGLRGYLKMGLSFLESKITWERKKK
jgi:hypothetical protein